MNLIIMSSRMTFHLTNSRRGTAKRFTISRILLWFIVFSGIVCCAVFGLMVREYFHLKSIANEAKVLETRLANQNELLRFQRKQIQRFAGEINALKDKLVSLGQFGNKVRVIANLEKDEEVENLFGVGGSVPADLDPTLDLKTKHSNLMRKMHEQMAQLNQETEIQQEEFESLIEALEEQQNLLARTPSIYPVKGTLTSTFGSRKSPFTGQSEFHKGLDIAAKRGTAVVAPADGRVTMADNQGSYGKMMVVDHGYGVVTRYAHLSKFLKKKGESVKRGQKIAIVGNTGRSTGPHLHYEVHLNGMPVDPQNYFMNSDDRQMVTYKK